ncbi:hypothetical protein ANCCEY_14634 [Ancylostoma ceylanicum]|uniref:Uncharacterized protein n=1 Tax=Ancylostoma ceylanicum TaxID=53326 RepID=A0A0D6L591_9BILA|nr:hypothetical protein ANCCEY_14634 [Ancylostoma ceylanicum]
MSLRDVLQIKEYEKMETPEERLTKAREIYDHHIMVEMLAHAHHVQYHLLKGSVPPDLFQVCWIGREYAVH